MIIFNIYWINLVKLSISLTYIYKMSSSYTSTPVVETFKRLENVGDCYHIITYTIEDGVEKFLSRELIINNKITDDSDEKEEEYKKETEKYLNIIKKEYQQINYDFHKIIIKKECQRINYDFHY